MAGPARARGLRGARLLRLVRPPPVHRWRGHGLDRLPGPGLEQADLVADGDVARLDDPGEHAAAAVQLLAKTRAQLVHPLARLALDRHLEDRVAHRDPLAGLPGLHIGAGDGEVLADLSRLDADRVEVL